MKIFRLALLFCFAGCATIASGTAQSISISTEPSQAELTLLGGPEKIRTNTPAVVELDRNRNYLAVIKKEGYKEVRFELKRGTSGWAYANAAFGGLLGAGLDATNGSAYKFKESEFHIVLESV